MSQEEPIAFAFGTPEECLTLVKTMHVRDKEAKRLLGEGEYMLLIARLEELSARKPSSSWSPWSTLVDYDRGVAKNILQALSLCESLNELRLAAADLEDVVSENTIPPQEEQLF